MRRREPVIKVIIPTVQPKFRTGRSYVDQVIAFKSHEQAILLIGGLRAAYVMYVVPT